MNRNKIETEADLIKYQQLICKQVVKRSGKPFKSTKKVNTVKSIIRHEQTGLYAFEFDEDYSSVECWRCKEFSE